jgi:hypothetical protein
MNSQLRWKWRHVSDAVQHVSKQAQRAHAQLAQRTW